MKSALGRLVSAAFASSSLSSSRIAAALALSSSGEGGTRPSALAASADELRCNVAIVGSVMKAVAWVSHGTDQASHRSFMTEAESFSSLIYIFVFFFLIVSEVPHDTALGIRGLTK